MRHKHIPDSKRYSILQDDLNYCYLCNNGNYANHLHEVFEGTANRQKSIDNGMVVGLCYIHHDLVHKHPLEYIGLKKHAQEVFEKDHTRQEFIGIFGRSYL